MKTINVSISEMEYKRFGLRSDHISFSEIVDMVSREFTKQRLNESIGLAEKYGLSKMTMDEISKEVKAVRKNAKNHT